MTLLAKSAQGKGGPDAIFAYSDMANKRAAEVGRENITNATLGTFLNAEGHARFGLRRERELRAVKGLAGIHQSGH